MKDKLNVLIIEDSKSYAQGMKLLLEQNNWINKVRWASNYDRTFKLLGKQSFNIVILDLNFETMKYDGFVIAKKIKELYPKTKIMILTQHTRINHHHRLFEECKVDAYLDKRLGVEETFRAISDVMDGKIYIDKNIRAMLEIKDWMKTTPRELEIINQLMKGYLQKEIANRMNISPKTVETHVRNLLKKFKVKNTVELIANYVKYINANREDIEGSTPSFQ